MLFRSLVSLLFPAFVLFLLNQARASGVPYEQVEVGELFKTMYCEGTFLKHPRTFNKAEKCPKRRGTVRFYVRIDPRQSQSCSEPGNIQKYKHY